MRIEREEMTNDFLSKIRKLNWILSESTTGSLSYGDLSRILSEVLEANTYILDHKGFVLGVYYKEADDTSTFEDEFGMEKVPENHNENFLSMGETQANLFGDDISRLLGEEYDEKEKYHTISPCICGGQRLGTILAARYNESFSDEDIALMEYGATVVGLEIQRNIQLEKAKERSLRMAVDMAMDTLSFSEKDALGKIQIALGDENECIIIASKIAQQYRLTNSVIVNALKKLESAGLLETKSLGMKGTYIKVVNPYLREYKL